MAAQRRSGSAHSRGRTAGIVGALVGLVAAGAAVGVTASRAAGRRVRAGEVARPRLGKATDAELRQDDPLGGAAWAADRTALVQADEGTDDAGGAPAGVGASGPSRRRHQTAPAEPT